MFGMPFFGSSGTSWNNSTAETYAQIVNAYAAANGGAYPAANLDSVTINGTSWGYNGVTTVQNKTQYAIQNGYGGVMIWELGQDYFNEAASMAHLHCCRRSRASLARPMKRGREASRTIGAMH